jgi:hypothetical protein
LRDDVGMEVTLAYARETAPQSVQDFMDWLAAEGFALVEGQGGPDAPFGDVRLRFERSRLAVRIVRDREQWAVDLAPAHGDPVPLHVLLTAQEGSTADISPTSGTLGGELPEVLPDGVDWRAVVPGVITWLETGDRDREISEAKAAWKQAWMVHFTRGRLGDTLSPSGQRSSSSPPVRCVAAGPAARPHAQRGRVRAPRRAAPSP